MSNYRGSEMCAGCLETGVETQWMGEAWHIECQQQAEAELQAQTPIYPHPADAVRSIPYTDVDGITGV